MQINLGVPNQEEQLLVEIGRGEEMGLKCHQCHINPILENQVNQNSIKKLMKQMKTKRKLTRINMVADQIQAEFRNDQSPDIPFSEKKPQVTRLVL
jgi:hypothetical protein